MSQIYNIYTDAQGKLAQKARDLALQARFTITVGGDDADYKTNGDEDTLALDLAMQEASNNPFGGRIVVLEHIYGFDNPALTEDVGGASLKKSCWKGYNNVTITCLPNANIVFNSGDPDTNIAITKTSAFVNFGNVSNFNLIDVNFDGLADQTGVDADEHSAIYFEGKSQTYSVVENCAIKVKAKNVASSVVRLRNSGVKDIFVNEINAKDVDCSLQITLGVENVFVDNIKIENSFAEGVLIAETSKLWFGKISAQNIERECFRITDTFRKVGCRDIMVDTIYARQSKNGIAGVCIEGSSDVIVDKIISEDNNKHGVFIGRPTSDARDVKNIIINSCIVRNNNQRIRTTPSSTDSGLRLFNTNDVSINNLYAYDDQTATNVLPKQVITDVSYILTEADDEIRTFGSNPTSAGARSFVLPDPATQRFNRTITFIDDKGNASVDNITITTASGLINGGSSAVINTDGGTINLRSNGTNWETAVATQYKGFFSDANEVNLKITGGMSYGNLQPSTYVGENTQIWFHSGVENRVINNFDLRIRDGSNGNGLRVFNQDITNNKELAIFDNDTTNNNLTILQNGILAQDRRALDIQINSDLVNSGTAGFYVSSSVNHTGNFNALGTIIQSGTTSIANLLRLDDGGAGTSLFLQKSGTFSPGVSMGRFDVASVMDNADNYGLYILSNQNHTGVGSALLRLFHNSPTSVAKVISLENESVNTPVEFRQNAVLAANQRVQFINLNAVLANAGSAGLSIISNQINTQASSALLELINDNADAGNVCRTFRLKDDGAGTALIIEKTNAVGSGVRLETATQAGFGQEIIATGLTTGSAFRVFSNSVDTSPRSVGIIENNSALAVGGVPLELKNIAPVATGFRNNLILSGITGITTKIGYGNGTSPDGLVSGNVGDIIINGLGNQVFICVGSTSPSTVWKSITSFESEDLLLTTSSGTNHSLSGRITTASLTTLAGATQTFTITNNRVLAVDDVIITFKSYSGTGGKPEIRGYTTADGSFTFDILNAGSTDLDGVVVVSYVVIKKY